MFPKTSVLTRATWRNIPEDAILHTTPSVEDFFVLVLVNEFIRVCFVVKVEFSWFLYCAVSSCTKMLGTWLLFVFMHKIVTSFSTIIPFCVCFAAISY
jgi:hypothetical protein